MKIRQRHRWDLTPKEAMALQARLAAKVVRRDDFAGIGRVAGADAGFEKNGATTRAAVAVLAFPSLQPETFAIARLPTRFPYVPGLLSFREVPAVLPPCRTSCTSPPTAAPPLKSSRAAPTRLSPIWA